MKIFVKNDQKGPFLVKNVVLGQKIFAAAFGRRKKFLVSKRRTPPPQKSTNKEVDASSIYWKDKSVLRCFLYMVYDITCIGDIIVKHFLAKVEKVEGGGLLEPPSHKSLERY